MRRIIIAIICTMCLTNSFSSAATIIKFYMNDGSPIQEVNIDDIDKMAIKKISNNFTMKVYFKKDSSSTYQTSVLDSLKFTTGNELKYFNVYYSALTKSYLVSEIDSIIYKEMFHTVTIGTQVWMKKNLDVSTYRNGDSIRYASSNSNWIDAGNKKEGAWCYYNNDPANGEIYGKLYNWYAVNDSRGLAPSGYHVPSDAEWATLNNYLQGNNQYWCSNNSNYIAKSIAAKELWSAYNGTCVIGIDLSANNSSGFTGLPGGFRYINAGFYNMYRYGSWWSSSNRDGCCAWSRGLDYRYYYLCSFYEDKSFGWSVRCLRD